MKARPTPCSADSRHAATYGNLSPAVAEPEAGDAKIRRSHNGWLDWCAAGFVAPALCTVLIWPLRDHFLSSSILIFYLLGVLLVAARKGRAASFLASLMSAAAFAYFFAPPIFSLAVADTENVIALAAMLIVAQVTGALVEALQIQVGIAAQRESHAAALYRLSAALAQARHETEVIETAVRKLHEQFGVRAVLLFPDRDGRLRYPTAPPLPESLRSADLTTAGHALHTGLRTTDQPDKGDMLRYHAIEGSGSVFGVMVLAGRDSVSASRPQPGQNAFLDLFRTQIAQALERTRLAEQAKEASLKVEAEALRNSLLGAISHDLRTPLTRIMSAAGILAEQQDQLTCDEQRELSTFIQDEAERISELTTKILDMARIAGGTIALQREWNTAEEIVGATLTRLDRVLDGRPVNIQLADTMPLLWADPVLLQQVLSNLIENAIKYTPASSPIDISGNRTADGLKLEVADRGPGIPDGFEARIFDKFFRIEPESPHGGAGLGLALCRAIVEAHDGHISAANRTGGGTVFTLSLPIHEPPAMAFE
ncbi:ATP-binding protein [Methylolobus aquaticus]